MPLWNYSVLIEKLRHHVQGSGSGERQREVASVVLEMSRFWSSGWPKTRELEGSYGRGPFALFSPVSLALSLLVTVEPPPHSPAFAREKRAAESMRRP
jgi:hypothetical protein